MKGFLLYFCISLLSFITNGQYSYKIIDIDTRVGKGSNPVNLTVFRNNVYFYATDSASGTELWMTDGNNASLVADINPGPESCIRNYNFSGSLVVYNCMKVIGDTLYFAATDTSDQKTDIYKYDGINPPSIACKIKHLIRSSNNIRQFTALNNILYFVADTGALHVIMAYTPSSGTIEYINTVPVYINTPIIPWNNNILFCGQSQTAGLEIHNYNPSSTVTNLIVDYSPGTANSTLNSYEIFDNKIYLKGASSGQVQLYEFDGINTIKQISNDIAEGTSLMQLHQTINPFSYFEDNLYYSVIKNGSRCIYQYNPLTGKKTYKIPVKLYPGGSYLLVYKGQLYFNDSNSSIYDFKSNVRRVSDVYNLPTTTYLTQNHYAQHDESLFIAANIDSSRDVELLILHDSTLSVSKVGSSLLSIIPYPNPTTQDAYLDIHLDKAQTFSVQLTDIQGRTVYKNDVRLYSQGQHKLTIPMHQIAAGTYVYKISDGNGGLLNSGRLLKQ